MLRLGISIFTILIISSGIFGLDLNIILNDNSIIKGKFIGVVSNEIYVRQDNDRAVFIKQTDIKAVFNDTTGNPVNISDLNQISRSPVQTAASNPPVKGPYNAIGLDIAGLVGYNFQLSYERALNDWISLMIYGSYSPDYFWGTGINYWEAALSARFYAGHSFGWFPNWNNGLRGFYAGLMFGYEGGSINYSYSDRHGSYNVTGTYPPAPLAGIEFGNKIIFGMNSGLFLEPRIAVLIPFGTWNEQISTTGVYTNGSGYHTLYGIENNVTFGLNLGYAF